MVNSYRGGEIQVSQISKQFRHPPAIVCLYIRTCLKEIIQLFILYLFALICQVKGADRVKTFENNEPKG
jgi:hypothetical protein